MSFWDTLVAARRRWYVVVLGLVATFVALQAIAARPPVFYSRSQMVFMAPTSELYPNKLQTTSMDLVITAGVVGKRINGPRSLPKTASPDATMVGRGVRDGVLITLPDHGGQWSPNYDTRALDVEVAAPTLELLRSRQQDAYARIADELVALQDEQGVAADQRIMVEAAPPVPSVRLLSGQPRRAQLMTLVLGGTLTLVAVALLELRSLRRRSRGDRPAEWSLVDAGERPHGAQAPVGAR